MDGVNIEETLFIVISKTLTTAETMLNARSAKSTLLEYYKEKYPDVAEKEIVSKHVCAVSTNLEGTS